DRRAVRARRALGERRVERQEVAGDLLEIVDLGNWGHGRSPPNADGQGRLVIHDSMVRDPGPRRSTKKPPGCGLFNDRTCKECQMSPGGDSAAPGWRLSRMNCSSRADQVGDSASRSARACTWMPASRSILLAAAIAAT